MKAVLVTGGCGFIGSHFVKLLVHRTDWRVFNLDKLTYAGNLESLRDIGKGSRHRFSQGDITDQSLVDRVFREEKPWAVVNFAAESHVDRSIIDSSPFLISNVIGVQVLLEAARKYKVERFLQVSTDEVYGDAEGKEPFEEESSLCPSSPYAASKAAADLLCLAYRRTYDIPVLIVRTSNNYGPYQFPEKLIPLTIRNVLNGEILPVYGDGEQRRDWLYVEDNVEAIFRVLESGNVGSIYNVATGEERTNLEVVRKVCQLVALETSRDDQDYLARIRFVTDRPGHDRRYAMKTEKIFRELNWSPCLPFDSAIKKTIRWYMQNQDWVERTISDDYRVYYDAVYTRGWKPSQL